MITDFLMMKVRSNFVKGEITNNKIYLYIRMYIYVCKGGDGLFRFDFYIFCPLFSLPELGATISS